MNRKPVVLSTILVILFAVLLCSASIASAKKYKPHRYRIVKHARTYDVVKRHQERLRVYDGARYVKKHGVTRYRVVGRRSTYVVLVRTTVTAGAATENTAIEAGSPEPTGLPATASSTQGDYSPTWANDGRASTRWSASSKRYPQWWMVDLGHTATVTGVKTDWYNGNKRGYRYRIETSLDGSTFTAAADRSRNQTGGTTTDAITVSARYVRVMVIGANTNGVSASAREVTVYSAPAPTPDPTPTPTPTPTVTPSQTPTSTPTPTPTVTPSQTTTPTPTPTPTPTMTSIPTATPTPTPTMTPTPTPTPTVTPTSTPPPAPTGLAISSLSATHASTGTQVTITGSGFGSTRGTSHVYFGELPQHTFSDGVVARPCTKEAASYVSWSETRIVVTVPSMSPGLAGAPGTYHPVYVEVGANTSNRSDFYIDPLVTLDLNTPVGDATTPGTWRYYFPNSNVTKVPSGTTYTNSAGSKHASYTTYVTLSSDSAAHPTWGNIVAANRHDVLIKDTTFVSLSAGLNPSDSGVITMGSYEAGQQPGGNIYNVTFYNCVIANNMQNNTGWSGTNAIKVYHGSESAGRCDGWTFSDCSFGTPNSPTGAFSRFTVEFVERNQGFSYYDQNYLSHIRFTGCDFEPPTLDPISLAMGGRGPDRGILVDDCLLKGSRHGGIEFHMYGLTVRDVDIWATRGTCFSMEGNSTEFGGASYIGPQSHTLFKRVSLHPNINYAGIDIESASYLINADHFGGVVFDDCDFDMGNASDHYGMASFIGIFDTCDGWDMSTSYIHGTASYGPSPKTSAIQYWYDWTGQNPATVYADNNMKWPILGARP